VHAGPQQCIIPSLLTYIARQKGFPSIQHIKDTADGIAIADEWAHVWHYTEAVNPYVTQHVDYVPSYCSIICCGVAAVVGDYTRHSSSYVCHATSSGAAACSLFVCYRQHMGQCMICVADCTGISALGAVTLLDVEKLLLR